MLSDATVMAIITAIPTTIVALGTLIVSVRNGQKVDSVQSAVNGTHTALKIELTAATNRILEMQAEIQMANSHIKKLITPIIAPGPAGPAGPVGPVGPPGAAALIGITGTGVAMPIGSAIQDVPPPSPASG